MGVDQLLSIVVQCRGILSLLPNRQMHSQLIGKIDEQLAYYKKDNKFGQLFSMNHNENRESKDKSLSKRRIFEDSSCDKSPKKIASNRKFNPKESLILGSSQVNSQSIQESRVQQIILNDIDSRFNNHLHDHNTHLNDNQSDTFVSLQSATTSQLNFQSIKVNQLIDNDTNVCKQVKTQGKKTEINDKAKKQQIDYLQIEDFFIIDFNFESNQYEILPKRQNCHNQPLLLIQNQLYQPQQNTSHLNNTKNNPSKNESIQLSHKNNSHNHKQQLPVNQVQLLKYSSHQDKPAVFPFAQISYQSPKHGNLSRISSFNRYSMQAQINSTDSRIIGLEKQVSANSKNQQSATTHTNIQQTYQCRQVILDLLIHNGTSHIRQIKPTSSMTELLKLTTNPSSKNKTLQHLILPSFLQMRQSTTSNCNRYTHVIKTYQGISYGKKYYQCERFYVIVERQKRFVEVGNIIRQLIKKAFQLRVKVDGEVDNVKASNIKKYISEIALISKQTLGKYAFSNASSEKSIDDQSYYLSPTINSLHSNPLYQVSLYCHSAMSIKFSIQTPPNSQPKSFNLILILTYFIIFQYKLIFLTTMGYQSTVSEVINSLVHMIGDLRYIYPIIMAVLTNHHIEFANAPIPGIVALWGKQARYKKALQFMKRKLKEQALESMGSSYSSSRSGQGNSSTTIVIDMNKHEFVDHQFTHKQLFIIENLQTYVKSQLSVKKSINILNIMNEFFNKRLLKDRIINQQQSQQSDPKNKWIEIMRDRLYQTQMYEEYMKFQDTIKNNSR